MVEEIAEIGDGHFYLKEVPENVQFNIKSINQLNMIGIIRCIENSRMLTLKDLSNKMLMDEDTINMYIQQNASILHLSNNVLAYSTNKSLCLILIELTRKKSITVKQIELLLESNLSNSLISELLYYTTVKGDKYTIRML
eukprot:GHVR01127206.1.p1 GENE.GHVR01127206.1~~GHVR01127206.1.p1  ORF type:complete len:140 (+),score=10.08 GHVR01127206.1:52-471(+)